MKKLYLAVDIGGTKTAFALFDSEWRMVYEQRVETRGKEGIEQLVDRIADCLNNFDEIYELDKIGLACPGPLDCNAGTIQHVATTGWNNVPICELFEKRFLCPTYLINDCSAALLGEYRFGAGKGYKNILYISVSTGIGGGILIDGKLYEGANGNAAEFGHLSIERECRKCRCGNTDCMELYASGTAIEKTYYNLTDRRMSSKEIAESARAGDIVAKRVYQDAGKCIGILVKNLDKAFAPDAIILGGGVTDALDVWEESMKEVLLDRNAKNICLRVSELHGKQGLYGAIYFIMNLRDFGRFEGRKAI